MNYRGKFTLAIVSSRNCFVCRDRRLAGVWEKTYAQQPINDAGAQIRIFESVLPAYSKRLRREPDLARCAPELCAVALRFRPVFMY